MSRRQHYRDFYGGPPTGAQPLAVVHGNCQAEALRVLLDGSPGRPWRVVRMPPVHELVAGDLSSLRRLLPACAVLVSQPVRDGYRGLPLGTREVAALLPPGGVTLRVPVVRDTAVHPWQALVRVPDGAEPPVVPYHDLRTLTGRTPHRPDLAGAAGRAREELARRERRDTDVGVSDLLPGRMHTLNHPGNGLLVALARRVQQALGVPVGAGEPGRELLGGIRAPREPEVLEALGLADPQPHWLVGGEVVDAEVVGRAQRDFYARRPDVVAAGLARHGPRLAVLGLA